MKTEQEQIDLAASKLSAVYVGGGEYAYYAYETGTYWVVDTQDMIDLGTMLADGTPDAYSLWCADTLAEEMPEGWEPQEVAS